MTEFFESIDPTRYAGPDSDDPLAFRWYQPDRMVGGTSMAEQFRFGVCPLIASGDEPEPVSGRQELLERLIARHIDTVR